MIVYPRWRRRLAAHPSRLLEQVRNIDGDDFATSIRRSRSPIITLLRTAFSANLVSGRADGRVASGIAAKSRPWFEFAFTSAAAFCHGCRGADIGAGAITARLAASGNKSSG